MAERRMMSNSIIKSARFLKMPAETQNLYFHLCLAADDDGIAEAFTTMRLIGATEDSLKLLAAKQYVTVLNDDFVSFIMDWREHNKIRSDRKIDSIYKDLLLQVLPDVELLEGTVRADRKHMDRSGTSQGLPSIGKDSIVEVSKKPKFSSDVFTDEEINMIIKYRSSIKSALKSQKGFKGLENKLLSVMDKFNYSLIQVLDIMAENEWQSIEADWLKNKGIKPIQAKRLGGVL